MVDFSGERQRQFREYRQHRLQEAKEADDAQCRMMMARTALSSFVDDLQYRRQIDPVELRLKLAGLLADAAATLDEATKNALVQSSQRDSESDPAGTHTVHFGEVSNTWNFAVSNARELMLTAIEGGQADTERLLAQWQSDWEGDLAPFWQTLQMLTYGPGRLWDESNKLATTPTEVDGLPGGTARAAVGELEDSLALQQDNIDKLRDSIAPTVEAAVMAELAAKRLVVAAVEPAPSPQTVGQFLESITLIELSELLGNAPAKKRIVKALWGKTHPVNFQTLSDLRTPQNPKTIATAIDRLNARLGEIYDNTKGQVGFTVEISSVPDGKFAKLVSLPPLKIHAKDVPQRSTTEPTSM